MKPSVYIVTKIPTRAVVSLLEGGPGGFAIVDSPLDIGAVSGPAGGVLAGGAAGVSISGGAGITGGSVDVAGGIPVPMDGLLDGGVGVIVGNGGGPSVGGGVVVDSGTIDIGIGGESAGIGDIHNNNFDRISDLNNIVDSLNIGNTINH